MIDAPEFILVGELPPFLKTGCHTGRASGGCRRRSVRTVSIQASAATDCTELAASTEFDTSLPFRQRSKNQTVSKG